MKPSIKKGLKIGVVVLLVQMLLIGGYLVVERQKNRDATTSLEVSSSYAVDIEMPQLTVKNRQGKEAVLSASSQYVVIHFWASWCAPCRVELPGIVGLEKRYAVDVVTIALDREWSSIADIVKGLDTSNIFLGDHDEAAGLLGVRILPVTLVVGPSGRITHRFDGARDWTDPTFLHKHVDGIFRNTK